MKNKSNIAFITIIIVLLIICIGMGTFIFINKDKLHIKEQKKETTNEKVNSEYLKASYYESKKEDVYFRGVSRYYLTLINKFENSGYFRIIVVSPEMVGGQEGNEDGKYLIEDNKIKLSFGPYDGKETHNPQDHLYTLFSLNEKDKIHLKKEETTYPFPGYYLVYEAPYNDKEITIENVKLYKI